MKLGIGVAVWEDGCGCWLVFGWVWVLVSLCKCVGVFILECLCADVRAGVGLCV